MLGLHGAAEHGLGSTGSKNHKKTPLSRGFCSLHDAWNQSPRVSSEALPPAAVVFTVTVFSVAKRSR